VLYFPLDKGDKAEDLSGKGNDGNVFGTQLVEGQINKGIHPGFFFVVNTQRRFAVGYRGKLMVICGERPACCEILLLPDHLEEICR